MRFKPIDIPKCVFIHVRGKYDGLPEWSNLKRQMQIHNDKGCECYA